MKFSVVIFLLVSFLSSISCSHYVIRDEKYVRMDYIMLNRVVDESAKTILALQSQSCTCVNGHWATKECEDAAKTYLFLKTRMPFHFEMLLYNSGLTEKRPGEIPEIPMPDTLCPGYSLIKMQPEQLAFIMEI